MLTSAKTSGIVTGDAPVSYWPVVFSLAPVTVWTVFVKLNLAHIMQCIYTFFMQF